MERNQVKLPAQHFCTVSLSLIYWTKFSCALLTFFLVRQSEKHKLLNQYFSFLQYDHQKYVSQKLTVDVNHKGTSKSVPVIAATVHIFIRLGNGKIQQTGYFSYNLPLMCFVSATNLLSSVSNALL